MKKIEIEKRFLVPENKIKQIKAKIIPNSKTIIRDVYIPNDNTHKNLRLRQENNKYMITRKQPTKGNDFTTTVETTIELSKREFSALSNGIYSNIEKERYEVDIYGRRGVLDIFTGRHAGLVIVEFEFQNETSLSSFEKNINLDLIDITNVQWLACGYLAEIDTVTLKQKLLDMDEVKIKK